MVESESSDSVLSARELRSTRDLLAWARSILDRSKVNYAAKEIDWMIMEASGCSTISLITESEKEISKEAAGRFRRFVRRRANGEPVQYVLGKTEFFALPILVNSFVLIPRPETEGLVERALEYIRKNPGLRVLDIGTGSGCIAVALAANEPELQITGVDVSFDALKVAQLNSINLAVEITWRFGDYNDTRSFVDLGGPFGLIVSNPPYVTADEFEGLEPEVRLHEPRQALTPGEDDTGAYRQLAILARRLLVPGGLILVEINEKLGREISLIFEGNGLKQVQVQTDLAGKDRYVLARAPDLNHEVPNA